MARQTVYLRIPAKREGFVDPQGISWSEGKEQQLWTIISKSKRSEVDWNYLSSKFQVPITFLQQQVFWLYEQELEQLKSKIQKGALSSETVGESPILQNATDIQADLSHNIFNKGQQSRSAQGFKSDHTIRRQSTEKAIESENETTESSEQSSDDDNYLGYGSMLLHRSRILSKVAPRFKDIVGDDADHNAIIEESLDSQTLEPAKKATTESSMSNISCMYSTNIIQMFLMALLTAFFQTATSISKSALEEALLEESASHF